MILIPVIASTNTASSSMKFHLFLTLLTLAAGRKIQTRELQYGYCPGSPEPFSFDEFVLEPDPVIVQDGATIHLAIGITLNEPIPAGSTTTLKIVRDDLTDVPMPCYDIVDIFVGSWWVENSFLILCLFICGFARTEFCCLHPMNQNEQFILSSPPPQLLILIVREVIFFMQAKHITGDFNRFFQGVKTFLTAKLS
jgi:hypothetical protein